MEKQQFSVLIGARVLADLDECQYADKAEKLAAAGRLQEAVEWAVIDAFKRIREIVGREEWGTK